MPTYYVYLCVTAKTTAVVISAVVLEHRVICLFCITIGYKNPNTLISMSK